MKSEQLDEVLKKLHSELQHIESLNDDEKKALRQTADDIQRLLNKESDQKQGFSQLAGRLRSQITTLEANHSNLTLLMGEAADALSKIGI